MPLPSPKSNETRNEFISRAMEDKIMKKDFPIKTRNGKNQRYAVASSIWKNKKNRSIVKEHLYIESYYNFINLNN